MDVMRKLAEINATLPQEPARPEPPARSEPAALAKQEASRLPPITQDDW